MKYKLIVALDFHVEKEALQLVSILDPTICALKIGNEMFTLFGFELVKKLVAKNFKVFLDLKFHDIPTTVSRACKAAAELGVWMVNVHASGGTSMLIAAREAIDTFKAHERPLLIAVTVLTSMHEKDLVEVGVESPLTDQVLKLSKIAKYAGLDGVVASALEVPKIKQLCGEKFLTVTPGIRLNSETHDQKRVLTPKQAYALGSDYLVIGRPITQAKDPLLAIQELFNYA